MIQSRTLSQLVTVICLCLLNSCGIDVGNPHGVSQGNLSVSLADAPVDRVRNVYLYVASLRVIPLNADGTEGEPSAIALDTSGKIDVLALQGGKSIGLSLTHPLAVGQYSGVILGLENANPGVVVDENGEEKPLPMSGGAHEIRIQQTFDVVSGQHLDLTLHIDLRRSIKQPSGDQDFAFDPLASLGRRDQAATIQGRNAPGEAVEVCAYLRRQKPEREGEDRLQPPGSEGDRPRPPGTVDARHPPSIGPDGNFGPIQDDNSCANAFAADKVSAGEFILAHLWPGEYQLVFFKADGSRLDAMPLEARVGPAQTLDFDAGSSSLPLERRR
jgi:hypothetical protein